MVLGLCVWAVVVASVCGEGRWFLPGRTVTSVRFLRRYTTELVPSSCALLQPDLTPCRNIRRMTIDPTPTTGMMATPDPRILSEGTGVVELEPSRDEVEGHAGGGIWGWWGATVTSTLYRPVTLRRIDPQTVITFSVKGCRPSRLPFDLPICNEDQLQTQSDSRDMHYLPET